ncbi:MAG: TerC family protein [Micropepsaceae bacterium]
MFDWISPSELTALWSVLVIDLVLAGDNAIVVGLAAASVPKHMRTKVIVLGIGLAVIMRIGFAVITVQLLEMKGVKLAGGLLLLWVCWRFYSDLRQPAHGLEKLAEAEAAARDGETKGLWRAIIQILVADLSMSLDNVLAVASAAAGHEWVLIVGLIVSVVLMAVAATLIARLLEKHRWIAWIGLAVILYVAIKMVWEGVADFGLVGHWPLKF